jgi:TonB family protein
MTTRLTKTFLLALFSVTVAVSANAQVRDEDGRGVGFTNESNGRSLAIKKVMPAYPEEAVEKGIKGIVEVRVGWDEQGVVRKIKVPPSLNPLFRKAIVDAVKQWQFKAHFEVTEKYLSHRLTFEFVIEDGKSHVQLYAPPLGVGARLREFSLLLEQREWVDWQDALDNTH